MDKKSFWNLFSKLCVTTRYAPRELSEMERYARDWYELLHGDLTDEEIENGFKNCRALKDFPSYPDFIEMAKGINSIEDEISLTVGNIMKQLNSGHATPEASGGFRNACGNEEIFEALGGHERWWRIQMGYCRIPNQTEIERIVKAHISKDRKEILVNNKKQLSGGKECLKALK